MLALTAFLLSTLLALYSTEKTELHIGVFIEVNTSEVGWNSAGIWPAIDLATRHINERSDILANYTLKLQQRDTRCSDAYAIKGLIELLQSRTKTIALIGPGCSIAAEPVADAAHFWNLIQVSYSAGTPRLSDKTRYPMFFRLNSEENIFNVATVALLRYFNWTKVAIVKQDEDIYNDVNENLQLELRKVGISVIVTRSFVNKPNNITADLRAKNARVVVALIYEDMARKLMCEAYRGNFYGKRIVWLLRGWYQNGWWKVASTPALSCTADQIKLAAGMYLSTEELVFSNTTTDTVSGWRPEELWNKYLNELKTWADNKKGQKNSYAPYGYDSMWVIAYALNRSISQLEAMNMSLSQFSYTTNSDNVIASVIKRMVLNTSINGMSGNIEFTKYGDRLNKIWIEQMQGSEEVRVATLDPAWLDTDPKLIKLEMNQAFQWPGGRIPLDGSQVIKKLLKINFVLFVVMATVAGIGILVTLLLLAFNVNHRHSRYIQQSSPQLNNFILIGCLVCYGCVFLFGGERFLDLGQAKIHSYLCNLRLWLLPIGFSLAFGAMFVKTWRVYRIFTNTTLHKNVTMYLDSLRLLLKYLHDKHLMAMVAVLLLIDCAYLFLWQWIAPMRSTESVIDKNEMSSGDEIILHSSFKCDSQYLSTLIACLYCYKGLLLVFGLFLAWETRDVKFEALNDSRYIGMSVYNVVISICACILLEMTVARDDPDVSFGLIASAINICTTCTLAFVFVPKIRNLRNFSVSSSQGQSTVNPSDVTKTTLTQHPSCPHCKCN